MIKYKSQSQNLSEIEFSRLHLHTANHIMHLLNTVAIM